MLTLYVVVGTEGTSDGDNIAHGRSLIVMTFELNFKLKLTLKSRFKGHSII